MEEIEWKLINGFDDRYSVNKIGEVKRHERIIKHRDRKCFVKEIILKPKNPKNRYIYYNLVNDKGKQEAYYAHRLVAEYFVDKVDGKNIINHKDGNKINNNYLNLEWCTYSENTLHAIRLGLRDKK